MKLTSAQTAEQFVPGALSGPFAVHRRITSIALASTLAAVSPTTASASTASEGAGPGAPVRFVYVETGSSRRRGWLADLLRAAKFLDVHKAITTIASFHQDHEYHLSERARDEGTHVLNLLYMCGAEAPKVFSTDSDSLSFSWERGKLRKFLTVSEGVASLATLSPQAKKVLASAKLKDGEMIGLLEGASQDVGGKNEAFAW